MENGKVKADCLKLKELYNRKGKCGKSKPDCLHGHRLIGVKVLDNDLKKASFRTHDKKKYAGRAGVGHFCLQAMT